MKTITRMMGLLVGIMLPVMATICPAWAEDDQAVEVGRVYYIEGDLLRYVPDENDWVAVVKDAPVGAEDTFFSGNQGMAELIVPNGSWIRVGNDTQIQVIALEPDLAEMDVAMGVARFYNKGSNAVIKATSPFGYVLADPGTVFDFYVGENSVEVVALTGTVSFVQLSTEEKYDVAAGSPSILADLNSVSSGEGTVDSDWDLWNETRENFWSAKSRTKSRSVEYLPPSLIYDADALDENGRWERIPYEGRDCWFWRPTTVIVGWSPFTMGVWTDWYGDQVWIPAEPFGYVTHHYGNWVYVRSRWYWAPPVVSVRVGLPLLDIGFFWNPGRVSWIHRGIYVGWVPLAPRETYYSHRNWGGRHHRQVDRNNVTQININIRNYTYVNRAIIVKQDNFYGVKNYNNVRETNINTTVINNYQAAPVVNNTVINNYTTNKQRYNYANVSVKEKPHNTVVTRIKENETTIRQGRKVNAAEVKQQVKNTREGKVNRDARIEEPRVTNYIVPADEVNRSKSEIKLQQKKIKTRAGTASGVRSGVSGRIEQQPDRTETSTESDQRQKPAVQPDRVIVPSRPGQDEKSVTQPESTAPAKETQKQKPAVQPDRVIVPSKPSQKETPAVQPGRVVTPARPTQQEKSVTQPERVAPAKETQKEKSDVQPDRVVVPSRPSQKETPAVQPGRVITPARPTQQEKQQPESATPAKETRKEKSAVQPGRTVTPSEPAQQEKASERPGRVVTPSKPVQPVVPAAEPDRVVTPSKPSQPETPAAQPNRVIVPSRPGQQEKPAAQPGRTVTPATPAGKDVDKSKKVEKPESAPKKGETPEQTRQRRLKEKAKEAEDEILNNK